MTNSTFFMLTALFVVCMAITSYALVEGSRAFRITGVASLVLAFVIAFFGLDHTMGRAKPLDIPGWSQPHYGVNGATVLGAQMTAEGAYLLLLEEGEASPRLFFFALSGKQMQALKKTMDETAKEQKGNPFGFKIKPGEKGEKKKGDKDGRGGGGPGSNGDKSLDDGNYQEFDFTPPVTREGPPKVRSGSGYREYVPN